MPDKRPATPSPEPAAKRVRPQNRNGASQDSGGAAPGEHALQRPATASSVPAPAPASQRFFDHTELLLVVFAHLTRERIDLLRLSRVSKHLRAVSLGVWARQLDLTLSSALDRLLLFQAYPALPSQVRNLRVRNDAAERGLWGAAPAALRRAARPGSWDALNRLLELIANPSSAEATHDPPLVDVTVSSRDPVKLPDKLKRRVVALRILPAHAAFNSDELAHDWSDMESDDEEDGNFGDSDEDMDDRISSGSRRDDSNGDDHADDPHADDGDGDISTPNTGGTYPADWPLSAATSQQHIEEDLSACSSWPELADIVQKADGLRTFRFGAAEGADVPFSNASVGGMLGDSYLQLWKALTERHAPTLRELMIMVEKRHMPEPIFRQSSTFPALRTFEFSIVQHRILGDAELQMVNAFLGRHAGHLEHISIDAFAPEGSSIGEHHTYPRLLYFHTMQLPQSLEERLAFAHRHPHVLQVTSVDLEDIPADTSAGEDNNATSASSISYPNLRLLPLLNFDHFRCVARTGRPLAGAMLETFSRRDEDEPADVLLRRLRWLQRHADVARRLSWVHLRHNSLDFATAFPRAHTDAAELRTLFSAGVLPNLAELSISLGDLDPHTLSFWPKSAQSEANLASVLRLLCGAPKLRVLHFHDSTRRFGPEKVLLDGATCFPPALEYVAWLDPPGRVPQYYRFVADDCGPSTDPAPAAAAASAAASAAAEAGEGAPREDTLVGKRGRLEPVPTVFRQRIATDGVWDVPFDAQQAFTVLNHGSPASRGGLDLS